MDYLTVVTGKEIADALAAQLDGMGRDIAERLKVKDYVGVRVLSEKAEQIDFLRINIRTNHLIELYDVGPERSQKESKNDQ
jgi:hypothetical protein